MAMIEEADQNFLDDLASDEEANVTYNEYHSDSEAHEPLAEQEKDIKPFIYIEHATWGSIKLELESFHLKEFRQGQLFLQRITSKNDTKNCCTDEDAPGSTSDYEFSACKTYSFRYKFDKQNAAEQWKVGVCQSIHCRRAESRLNEITSMSSMYSLVIETEILLQCCFYSYLNIRAEYHEVLEKSQ